MVFFLPPYTITRKARETKLREKLAIIHQLEKGNKILYPPQGGYPRIVYHSA